MQCMHGWVNVAELMESTPHLELFWLLGLLRPRPPDGMASLHALSAWNTVPPSSALARRPVREKKVKLGWL